MMVFRCGAAALALLAASVAHAQLSPAEEAQVYADASKCAALYGVLAQVMGQENAAQRDAFVEKGSKFLLLMTGIKGGDETVAGKDFEAGIEALAAELGPMDQDAAQKLLLSRLSDCKGLEEAIDRASGG